MTPQELRRLVPRPAPDTVNTGLTCPTAADMIALLGRPGPLTIECSEVYSGYRRRIVTDSVGPFRVTGHKTAVLGLRHVFEDVQRAGRIDLLMNVRTDGMLCCRKIRGRNAYSNHSWGMAVDLNFGPGEEMGDGQVQQGLLELYPFFHARKWFWGGGYRNPREDSMHFEISLQGLAVWKALGLL